MMIKLEKQMEGRMSNWMTRKKYSKVSHTLLIIVPSQAVSPSVIAM